MARQPQPVLDRIFSRVERNEHGCLLFTGGSVTKAGHRRIMVPGRQMKAVHRIVWEEAVGALNDGEHVLHTCDEPSCVEASHLFVGSHQDNMRDRDQKKRQARGEQQGLAKLNAEKVRKMRIAHEQGETIAALARRFGVSDVAAGMAVKGQTWRHI